MWMKHALVFTLTLLEIPAHLIHTQMKFKDNNANRNQAKKSWNAMHGA
jgi:hypothetical protein